MQIDSPEEKGAAISPKKGQKQSQDSSTQQNGSEMLKSEGTQAGGTLQNKSLRKEQLHHTKSADYTDLEMQNGNIFNIVNNNHSGKKSKSKSTDDMRIENAQNGGISLDSNTLKRMLKPMPSIDSPVTSPEMTRKRHSHHNYHYHPSNNNQKYIMQETENENCAHLYRPTYNNKFQTTRSVHDMGRQYAGTYIAFFFDSSSSSSLLFLLLLLLLLFFFFFSRIALFDRVPFFSLEYFHNVMRNVKFFFIHTRIIYVCAYIL